MPPEKTCFSSDSHWPTFIPVIWISRKDRPAYKRAIYGVLTSPSRKRFAAGLLLTNSFLKSKGMG